MKAQLFESEGIILIEGSLDLRKRALGRSGWSILLAGATAPMWRAADWDNVAGLGAITVTMDLIALILPAQSCVYLDRHEQAIIKRKYYSLFEISKNVRPIAEFSRIVVRHVCHPGGEGPDTFTGSVGLKPVDGGAVFWVHELEATPEEFPAGAYDFAKILHDWTGLPYPAVEERI